MMATDMLAVLHVRYGINTEFEPLADFLVM